MAGVAGKSAAPACPKCGSDDIELDSIQALTYCLDCGFVLTIEHLDISLLFEEDGQRAGVLVAENDDGSAAGAVGLPAGSRPTGRQGRQASQARVAARVRVLCGSLGVPASVQADALGLAQQLLDKLYAQGGLRVASRERTAAAALYIAARLAKLPLTAVDVALAIRIPTHAFGRTFNAAVKALSVSLPATPPAVFLRSAAAQTCSDQSLLVDVERDAVALHAWLAAEQPHATPLLRIATALRIALEAHGMKARSVSRVLHVSERCLQSHVHAAKLKLLQLAQVLPWAETVTARNVALHLQTILKLARIKQATDGGA